jgi:hypothetical protein
MLSALLLQRGARRLVQAGRAVNATATISRFMAILPNTVDTNADDFKVCVLGCVRVLRQNSCLCQVALRSHVISLVHPVTRQLNAQSMSALVADLKAKVSVIQQGRFFVPCRTCHVRGT